MIHAIASLPHYQEHIEAVWRHIPKSLRGTLSTGRFSSAAACWPVDGDIFLVAGYIDIDRCAGRPIVYIEHGAGQSYGGGHPGYHGESVHPDNVVGYVSPRQEVADSWGRPAVAVGSPVCDDFPLFTGNDEPIAVITFHWNCMLYPETRSALDHYVRHLGPLVHRLRSQGFRVFGHHHPRDTRLPTIWRNLHVAEIDARQMRAVADLLIVDNSSVAYEMLYLARSVVSLNAPWYRRDVNHGLRFWDAVPGLPVDSPEELLDLDFCADVGDPSLGVGAVAAYGKAFSDGSDGVRAAAWVTSLHSKL